MRLVVWQHPDLDRRLALIVTERDAARLQDDLILHGDVFVRRDPETGISTRIDPAYVRPVLTRGVR